MLVIKDLVKQYPGFELNCSMEVQPGRITGLIGQNGAGKSTLFKCVLQLVFPQQGTIELFGKNIKDLKTEDKERIGTVLSDSGFSQYLRIVDTKSILKNFYSTFDEVKFTRLCRQLGLDESKKIMDLSTGMKAKLKVIAAVTHDTDIMILDEPTAGLDVLAREDVLTMLRNYMEEKPDRSILISSHISSDLETLCDDFYMINDGKIILHEDTDRLLSDYALIKTDVSGYETLDKQYLLRRRKETWGYSCLTNQRAYYAENYPETIIEKTGIDELITLMIKGETI
ncbi:MAG: ABC transporter ATP-binding protein [Erysipelotrichaceae bacterium]|nr:ABC transporter ATP-binding protein [Erysipelotrichaceae bacterium]